MGVVHFFLVLTICYQFLKIEGGGTSRLPIGGLFSKKNEDRTIYAFGNFTRKNDYLKGQIIQPSVEDSYSIALTVCDETTASSIVALIDGRATNSICDTTCLLCNSLNIPYLSLGWEPIEPTDDAPFIFSYHPPPETISKAYATLIKDFQWDRFSILYESDDGLIRLQEIMNTWPDNQEPIVLKKLDPIGDNRDIFKYIFKVAHISYHVLDCHENRISKYMKEIVDVENSTQYQSFIFTALDAYKLNFEDNLNWMANVSTLHLTYNQREEMRWLDVYMNASLISLETALVADAIHHLDKAVSSINMNVDPRTYEMSDEIPNRSVRSITNTPALCFHESRSEYIKRAWPIGHLLKESIRTTSILGFTGNVSFDDAGRRIDFILHYSKLNSKNKFDYIGSWDSKTDSFTKINDVSDRSFADSNKPIRVVSRKGKPYFDIDESNGNNTFKGFAVDLIDAIFKHINENSDVNLKYEFYRVNGDGYGNPIAGTKKWDGIIGELLEHNADMAICDLTITSERIAVVDFSTPFMTLGISMLFKIPPPVKPDKFSFIQPLSVDVWLSLGTAYIITSFMLLISARMSQGDWVNPHPCNRNPDSLQNIWDLYNCMWSTMGAIMTQGCDILPRAFGSRWVTGMWWFFALIIAASYTANMSTFLSNKRRSNDISNVNDLVKQNKVRYGAVYNASTFKFFKNSNESVYKKIWSVMESTKPSVFTSNNDEGKNRVVNGKDKYVFFMESTAIEYYTQRNCDLKMVGSKLDSKEYGIAMPKNFPHKRRVDNAILAMQESGDLDELKKKWWEKEDKIGDCSIKTEDDDTGSLQMENMSGIFLVLGLGGFIGLVVAVIDFFMQSRKIAVNEKVTFREAMYSEWRTSLNPRVLHKPAAPPRSAAASTRSPSPLRERSASRAVSVLRAATSFINFDEIY